jgi:hypothetical protein
MSDARRPAAPSGRFSAGGRTGHKALLQRRTVMNKFNSTLVMAALMCVGTSAFANDAMKHNGSKHAASMDANGDGMISQKEFTDAHNAKWAALPKNKDGLVAVADAEKSIDANADGMVSQKEFTDAHEAKWAALPKNKDGLVAVADVAKMHNDSMKPDSSK